MIVIIFIIFRMQEADLGFHIIIDRRRDRWSSVKTALLKISAYFPGLIQVVYVIRPESFLQKALSEVSNKLFKEEFKFRFVILSTSEELFEYIEPSQLTTELGGTLQYSHEDWIQQRIVSVFYLHKLHSNHLLYVSLPFTQCCQLISSKFPFLYFNEK